MSSGLEKIGGVQGTDVLDVVVDYFDSEQVCWQVAMVGSYEFAKCLLQGAARLPGLHSRLGW